MRHILQLRPSHNNPRNSEGSFIQLQDGRILFIYTRFSGGYQDHDAACLVARLSPDNGQTWTTDDELIVANEGKQNVMSVSLLRLPDRRIALFYERKNSSADCRPYLRYSSDEGHTWTTPITCISDNEMGYYVLLNDRVVQLRSGRLVMPVALHNAPGWPKWTSYGVAMCYLSDDQGQTWRRSVSTLDGKMETRHVIVQEPGVIELKNGRLMMFCRTDAGYQYFSYSEDGGDHWSPLQTSAILSPLSPASIKRIPNTGDLLMIWNNSPTVEAALQDERTPLTAAISRDEGKSWNHVITLENDPEGWYCYTAIHFAKDNVLLAYCSGNRREYPELSMTQISKLPIAMLYKNSSHP
ncbi:MAG: exo-alpha-sialidase [Gammaproteobacteria bacterium]|nr:exo-alpha-sialidase [Gammaproteobacteria bacterium]